MQRVFSRKRLQTPIAAIEQYATRGLSYNLGDDEPF